MPKYSIIVPVYNAERYLDECIRSVVEQKYSDFELLLVNDGSTDNSAYLCDEWAAKDDRIRVFHKENGGAASARNLALSTAQGEYIGFLDSDDYWISDDVLLMLDQRICCTKPDVLVYNLQKEYGGRRESPYFEEKIVFPEKLSATESEKRIAQQQLWTACACNKLVKARFFENGKLRFRVGNTSEDIDWTLRLALAVQRFDYVNVCAVSYRQRLSSVTGNMTPAKLEILLENVFDCMRLAEAAEETRQIPRPYAAYQYGTLVYNIAMLSPADRKALIPRVKNMAVMLKWSNHPKIQLLRIAKQLLGFSMMLRLVRLKGILAKNKAKRSD